MPFLSVCPLVRPQEKFTQPLPMSPMHIFHGGHGHGEYEHGAHGRSGHGRGVSFSEK